MGSVTKLPPSTCGWKGEMVMRFRRRSSRQRRMSRLHSRLRTNVDQGAGGSARIPVQNESPVPGRGTPPRWGEVGLMSPLEASRRGHADPAGQSRSQASPSGTPACTGHPGRNAAAPPVVRRVCPPGASPSQNSSSWRPPASTESRMTRQRPCGPPERRPANANPAAEQRN